MGRWGGGSALLFSCPPPTSEDLCFGSRIALWFQVLRPPEVLPVSEAEKAPLDTENRPLCGEAKQEDDAGETNMPHEPRGKDPQHVNAEATG